MLTGPVTILAWSFVRDDQPLGETANQVALALRDEIADLEAAGIGIIQVDEPALRELLPLKKADQPAYLDWSVGSFRLATAGAATATQVHTHLCYSEFDVVIDAIAALDADVTSIEAARSRGEVIGDIAASGFAHGIGPGVYDIHSPRVPSVDEITELLDRAVAELPLRQRLGQPGLRAEDPRLRRDGGVAAEPRRGDAARCASEPGPALGALLRIRVPRPRRSRHPSRSRACRRRGRPRRRRTITTVSASVSPSARTRQGCRRSGVRPSTPWRRAASSSGRRCSSSRIQATPNATTSTSTMSPTESGRRAKSHSTASTRDDVRTRMRCRAEPQPERIGVEAARGEFARAERSCCRRRRASRAPARPARSPSRGPR